MDEGGFPSLGASEEFEHVSWLLSRGPLSDARWLDSSQRKAALMYAKILILVGEHHLPGILATTSRYPDVKANLKARGWDDYGRELPVGAAGEITIGSEGFQVVVDGMVMLSDDVNPVSPAGWWAAVDQLQGRCLVIVAPTGVLDFESELLGAQLDALRDTGQAINAGLPVLNR